MSPQRAAAFRAGVRDDVGRTETVTLKNNRHGIECRASRLCGVTANQHCCIGAAHHLLITRPLWQYRRYKGKLPNRGG